MDIFPSFFFLLAVIRLGCAVPPLPLERVFQDEEVPYCRMAVGWDRIDENKIK